MKTIILTVLTVLSINLNAQKNTYKVNKTKTFITNSVSGDLKLVSTIDEVKYLYIDTEKGVIDIPNPYQNTRTLCHITDFSIDYDDNSKPIVHFKTVDKEGRECDVWGGSEEIAIVFKLNGTVLMINYFITKI